MAPNHFDVAVVGSGPAGSIAAYVLAKKGLHTLLLDKASFPRDKACGDVIGPKAIANLASIGIELPPQALHISDMAVLGPTGKRITLKSQGGLDYAGIGATLPRLVLDNYLREHSLAQGVEARTARVVSIAPISSKGYSITLSTTEVITCNYLIGADGANSKVASDLSLIDESDVLWGFAVRSYLEGEIALPTISMLSDTQRRLFPGYGWAFESSSGRLNIGIGVGFGTKRTLAARAGKELPSYIQSLKDTRTIESQSLSPPRLGGWLKMGMVGTIAARSRALLVGDAAGLINPLQGEGIAAAIDSAIAAALAIASGHPDPSIAYRQHLFDNHFRFQVSTALLHKAAITRPNLAYYATAAITSRLLGTLLAPAWGIYWNDLLKGSGPINGAWTASLASAIFYGFTAPGSAVRKLDLRLRSYPL